MGQIMQVVTLETLALKAFCLDNKEITLHAGFAFRLKKSASEPYLLVFDACI